jgi:hypothetical protein
MIRRSPIKAKREGPRRNEGRIQHKRIKRKAVSKTTEEAKHIAAVAEVGCLVCGAAAQVHHIMHCARKERRRDHRFVAPLCAEHHTGFKGVHGLGGEEAFAALYRIDLVGWAVRAWDARGADIARLPR